MGERRRQPRPVAVAHNNYARWSVQAGGGAGSGGARTPLWDLGLNGSGQVVGVADTGLDDASCFFRDATLGNVPRSAAAAASDPAQLVTDAAQRKVVQYVAFVDGEVRQIVDHQSVPYDAVRPR